MNRKQNQNIKILIVDDHEVVRSGIKMLLANHPRFNIVAEARNGKETLFLTRKIHPEVIIMDITLPDISGIETTKLIKKDFPDIHIIALTIHEDEEYFFEMLEAGSSGYVPKRAAPEDLIDAINTVISGEIYLYPSLTKLLVIDFLQRQKNNMENRIIQSLTPRENEIMELIANGYTNDEIAQMFSISKHTVARHRENIMQKLDLHNRSELVRYAIRKGIIKA